MTPFKGANRNETFKNVLCLDITFPNYVPVSSAGKSLIRKLLQKDEHRRLGSRAGASEIKAHAFFKNISWALLRHMTPPIVPDVKSPGDTSHFRKLRESTSLDWKDTPSIQQLEDDLFTDFESGMSTTINSQ